MNNIGFRQSEFPSKTSYYLVFDPALDSRTLHDSVSNIVEVGIHILYGQTLISNIILEGRLGDHKIFGQIAFYYSAR